MFIWSCFPDLCLETWVWLQESLSPLPGLEKVGRDFVTPGFSEPPVRRQLGLLAGTPPALTAGAWIEIVKITTASLPHPHLSLDQIFHFLRFLPRMIQPGR
jgi:hypothetical protein